MSAISTETLSLGYGETIIIDELNLTIPKGEITVFISGNERGKSTLLRSLARLMKPKGGSVLLEGGSIAKLPTKEVAKELAILPQGPSAPEGLTVLQLVRQGRYPYQNWLKQWSAEDEEAVQRALKATRMEELAERTVDSLSGGQQRRLDRDDARPETDIILLDEPTTYLDMTHQIEILDLLFELNEHEKRTIVMVAHDLNLACRYAHHLVAIKDKKIYAEGRPESIINCKLVQDVFEMDCEVTKDPLFGTPHCIPYGKGRCIVQQVVQSHA